MKATHIKNKGIKHKRPKILPASDRRVKLYCSIALKPNVVKDAVSNATLIGDVAFFMFRATISA